jgi:hypothetical protein
MGKVVKMKRLKGKGDRFFGAGRQATEPFSKSGWKKSASRLAFAFLADARTGSR